MQNSALFVAGWAVRIGGGCWMGQDSANRGLKGETWFTRIRGGVEESGCAISIVAVAV
jgi:hypothetical protein